MIEIALSHSLLSCPAEDEIVSSASITEQEITHALDDLEYSNSIDAMREFILEHPHLKDVRGGRLGALEYASRS